MTYVRYADYQETISADFDNGLQVLLEEVVKETENSVEKQHAKRAVRIAHGKSYGLVRATVTVHDGLPAKYAQGIYSSPGEYEAVIRYSNGLPHLRPDSQLGAACGMGIKLFGIPGPSLLEDERDATTFDYNLINNSTFFCNTARDYQTIMRLFIELPDALLSPETRNKWMYNFLTRDGSLPPEKWLWDEYLTQMKMLGMSRQNLLTYSYWSMGAFRHGDYIAKIRVVPVDEDGRRVEATNLDLAADPEAFRNTLIADLTQKGHQFDLQIQLCKDLNVMPVSTTSVDWPESVSEFVTVARIDIPRQDISGEDNLVVADGVSITPWRVREAHKPLSEINLLRKEVYRQSSILRHNINGQRRVEADTPDELWGRS